MNTLSIMCATLVFTATNVCLLATQTRFMLRADRRAEESRAADFVRELRSMSQAEKAELISMFKGDA